MRMIGYLISFVGILILASGLKTFNATVIKIVPLLGTIKPMILMIIGGVLVVLGIILLGRNGTGTRRNTEVPIYRGNKIVGYRRH